MATVVSGIQTANATVTALPTGTLVSGLVVTADLSNSVPVYIGPSGMSVANAFFLNPGDSVTLAVTSPSDVYIALATSVAGQGVAFVGT